MSRATNEYYSITCCRGLQCTVVGPLTSVELDSVVRCLVTKYQLM